MTRWLDSAEQWRGVDRRALLDQLDDLAIVTALSARKLLLRGRDARVGTLPVRATPRARPEAARKRRGCGQGGCRAGAASALTEEKKV